MKEFKLTDDHIKLLRRAYVGWQDCETGAPEINPKRPYGNSSVVPDVAEILGIVPVNPDGDDYEERYGSDVVDRLRQLHRETETALQIILATGEFKVGTYRRGSSYSSDRAWTLVPE
jgi:hypothetical protein